MSLDGFGGCVFGYNFQNLFNRDFHLLCIIQTIQVDNIGSLCLIKDILVYTNTIH